MTHYDIDPNQLKDKYVGEDVSDLSDALDAAKVLFDAHEQSFDALEATYNSAAELEDLAGNIGARDNLIQQAVIFKNLATGYRLVADVSNFASILYKDGFESAAYESGKDIIVGTVSSGVGTITARIAFNVATNFTPVGFAGKVIVIGGPIAVNLLATVLTNQLLNSIIEDVENDLKTSLTDIVGDISISQQANKRIIRADDTTQYQFIENEPGVDLTFLGSNLGEEILIRGGPDVFVSGGGGADTIRVVGTGIAADNITISAGPGNDTIVGGTGADIIDGGLDIDTADYGNQGSTDAVIGLDVDNNIAINTDSFGSFNQDTLTNIEILKLSFNDDFVSLTNSVLSSQQATFTVDFGAQDISDTLDLSSLSAAGARTFLFAGLNLQIVYGATNFTFNGLESFIGTQGDDTVQLGFLVEDIVLNIAGGDNPSTGDGDTLDISLLPAPQTDWRYVELNTNDDGISTGAVRAGDGFVTFAEFETIKGSAIDDWFIVKNVPLSGQVPLTIDGDVNTEERGNTVDFSTYEGIGGLVITLGTNEGELDSLEFTNIENIIGTAEKDEITGTSTGGELLIGAGGDDILDPGTADLNMPDILWGGEGNDTFVIPTTPNPDPNGDPFANVLFIRIDDATLEDVLSLKVVGNDLTYTKPGTTDAVVLPSGQGLFGTGVLVDQRVTTIIVNPEPDDRFMWEGNILEGASYRRITFSETIIMPSDGPGSPVETETNSFFNAVHEEDGFLYNYILDNLNGNIANNARLEVAKGVLGEPEAEGLSFQTDATLQIFNFELKDSGIVLSGNGPRDDTPNSENLISGEALSWSPTPDIQGGQPDVDSVTEGTALDDVLQGSPLDDLINGGDGNDRIEGGEGRGNDIYDGGPGNDTVFYPSARLGITADLAAGLAFGIEIDRDTLISIENVEGGTGDDVLRGDANVNILRGDAGNDLLNGRAGADTLDGQDGLDTADYSDSDEAVIINLETGSAAGGHAEGDTLLSIENLLGSAFDDQLTGDDGSNVLSGNAGDDVLVGGLGADELIGDAGQDTADYSASGAGININLSTGLGTGGDAEGDTLTSIENIIGSGLADIITGDDQDNILIGLGGADALSGGLGQDTADYNSSGSGVSVDLFAGTGLGGDAEGDTFSFIENITGSAFADTLNGDDQNNILAGLAGADALIGGLGQDTADYSTSSARVRINLLAGTALEGDAEGDTLASIENLFGSGFNDVLLGDSNVNELTGGAGDDYLRGGLGADLLNGGTGRDRTDYTLSDAAISIDLTAGTASGGHAEGDILNSIENVNGTAFDDTLTGNSERNTLLGREGNDILAGGAEKDYLRGGAGADILDGGADRDGTDYSTSDAAVNIDLSTGIVSGGHADGDTLISIENAYGSAFNDTLTGNDERNTLLGRDGNDNLFGGAENDSLRGGAGADTIDGGAGRDASDYSQSDAAVTINLATGTVSGGYADGDTLISIENAYGSAFNDTLTGNSERNTLLGREGDDILAGGAEVDYLRGGAGADVLDGGEGRDGADYFTSDAAVNVDLATGVTSGGHAVGDTFISIENLYGSEFDDTLSGNDERNTLLGRDGNDLLFGGSENDYLRGGAGADTLNGGSGRDAADYSQSDSAVTIDLSTGILSGGHADGDVLISIENAYGSAFNDNITGDDGNNSLIGRDGDDLLSAGAGNDYIRGDDGNDTAFGEAGNDRYLEGTDDTGNDYFAGGLGDDTFTFQLGGGSNVFDGGEGTDVAIFYGNLNEFEIVGDEFGGINIQDTVDETVQNLVNVETLRFNDGDFDSADFLFGGQ